VEEKDGIADDLGLGPVVGRDVHARVGEAGEVLQALDVPHRDDADDLALARLRLLADDGPVDIGRGDLALSGDVHLAGEEHADAEVGDGLAALLVDLLRRADVVLHLVGQPLHLLAVPDEHRPGVSHRGAVADGQHELLVLGRQHHEPLGPLLGRQPVHVGKGSDHLNLLEAQGPGFRGQGPHAATVIASRASRGVAIYD